MTCNSALRTLPDVAYSCSMVITGDEFRDMREIVVDITQQEMADALGVSLRTIGNWEANGVPTKRESRVLAKFGQQLKDMRRGIEMMDARDEWARTPEGRAALEADAIWASEEEERRTDPVGYGLRNATDRQLLDEVSRRLSQRAARMSEADVMLAANNPGYQPADEQGRDD